MTVQASTKAPQVDFFEQLNSYLNLSHYVYLHLNFNNKDEVQISVQDSKQRDSEENDLIIQTLMNKENLESLKTMHSKLTIKHFVPCDLFEHSLNKAFIAKIHHNKVAVFVYRTTTGILDNVQENFLRLNLDMNPRLFNSK